MVYVDRGEWHGLTPCVDTWGPPGSNRLMGDVSAPLLKQEEAHPAPRQGESLCPVLASIQIIWGSQNAMNASDTTITPGQVWDGGVELQSAWKD
jgi:hypothetical protein